MNKVSWKLFKRSFPFICDSCKTTHWEMREYCEGCGKKGTIRETLKVDYTIKKKEG